MGLTPLRVSFVGMGAMGRRHARVMGEIPSAFALTSGFDPHVEADGWPANVRRAASLSEAIEDANLVVIATPAGAHAPQIREALEAGRHVFVEKPLTVDALSARALVAVASRAEREIFVGHSERFNPVVLGLRRALSARGETPTQIVIERRGPSRVEDVGVLLNFGVHDFDIMELVAASRVRIALATGRSERGGRGRGMVERSADVHLTWGAQGRGEIRLERTLDARRRRIHVVTNDATYDGDMIQGTLIRTTNDGETPLALPEGREPLACQAEAIVRALTVGDGEIARARDGSRAVELATHAFEWLARNSASPTGVHARALHSTDEESSRASSAG